MLTIGRDMVRQEGACKLVSRSSMKQGERSIPMIKGRTDIPVKARVLKES